MATEIVIRTADGTVTTTIVAKDGSKALLDYTAGAGDRITIRADAPEPTAPAPAPASIPAPRSP